MMQSRTRVHPGLCRVISLLVLCASDVYALSSLSRNDPYPMYSSLDPHTFLFTQEKLKLSDPDLAMRIRDSIGISLSPFGQNSVYGRDIYNQKTALGNIPNRWNMLALLYGQIPAGQTMAPLLLTALNNLFPGVVPGTLDDGTKIDRTQQLGFFSIPIKYKKRGVRFDLQANMIGGFGIEIQTGVVSMTQTVTTFDDLTCNATPSCAGVSFDNDTADSTALFDQFKKNTEKYLMKELQPIAAQILLDIDDFSAVSMEEVRFNLYWRNGYELNRDDDDWPHFLFIPFFEIGGSVSPGTIKDPNKAGFNERFAAPFGNNGHNAVGFVAGFDIDFVESMEIGAEVGTTFFFKRNFDNMRIPTSEFQTGIYPFRTDATVQPGINWHFGAKLSAYHFIDRLSAYFQYIQLQHQQDKITLRKCSDSSVFLPEQLEDISGFKVKLANVGFNYDISPNIGLGFLWQAPISQYNAYKATTLLLSLNVVF